MIVSYELAMSSSACWNRSVESRGCAPDAPVNVIAKAAWG